MEGARGVLFNIVGGNDLTMTEVDEAAKIISSSADPDANIIFGATIDETMHDQIRITVVATGFDQTKQRLQQFVSPHYSNKTEQQSEVKEYSSNNPFVTNGSSSYQQNPQDSQQHQQQSQQQDSAQNAASTKPVPQKKESEEDEWDIPAFLRQRN